MTWRMGLTAEEGQEVRAWLERVLHDLVKYLEMMPRSLEWSALSEDDIECLWESIFETRSFRGEVQSAAEIWQIALTELPAELRGQLPWLKEVTGHVKALMEVGERLDEGEFQSETLRAKIFAVGDHLRSQKEI